MFKLPAWGKDITTRKKTKDELPEDNKVFKSVCG